MTRIRLTTSAYKVPFKHLCKISLGLITLLWHPGFYSVYLLFQYSSIKGVARVLSKHDTFRIVISLSLFSLIFLQSREKVSNLFGLSHKNKTLTSRHLQIPPIGWGKKRDGFLHCSASNHGTTPTFIGSPLFLSTSSVNEIMSGEIRVWMVAREFITLKARCSIVLYDC